MTGCPRCAEVLPSPRPNFCTMCGYDLRPGQARGSVTPFPPPVVRLTTCTRCGATNAASRSVCGRCRSALGSRDVGVDVVGGDVAALVPQTVPLPAEDAESSWLLLVVTVTAGLLTGIVVLILLGARGVGLLPTSTPTTAGSESLEVATITASSTLPPAGQVTYEAANLLDGDPSTAWNEGARGAVGEWVELQLREEAEVTRLLVWNGYQKDAQFARNGRVRRLLIDAGGRRFTVELLSVDGSQAVDLPQPVRTQTIRLTVDAIFPGDRYPDTAMSEIEVYGRHRQP